MKRFNITVYKSGEVVGEYQHAYDYQIASSGTLIVFPTKHYKEIWPPHGYSLAEVEKVKVPRGGGWSDGP